MNELEPANPQCGASTLPLWQSVLITCNVPGALFSFNRSQQRGILLKVCKHISNCNTVNISGNNHNENSDSIVVQLRSDSSETLNHR